MSVLESYRSLGHIFSSGAIVIMPEFYDSEQREEHLFFPSEDYIYGVFFNSKTRNSEEFAREGLWWCMRQKRFVNFGLNGKSKDRSKVIGRVFPILRKQKKLWQLRWGFPDEMISLCVVSPIELVYLSSRKEEARNLVNNWIETGKLPYLCRDLLEGKGEDINRIYRMIGLQTLKAGDNKGFGGNLKSVIRETKEKMREERRKIEMRALTEIVRRVAVDRVAGVAARKVIGLGEAILNSCEWGEQKISRAIGAIVEGAYSIRQGYERKGNEVKHGLVHAQAYRKLEKIASENAEPEIVSTILHRADQPGYGWGLFKEEFRGSMMPRRMFPYEYKYGDAIKVGRLRTLEFIEDERVPYKNEARLMTKMLTHNLNRAQFRDEVNRWIGRYCNGEFACVNWEELDKEKGNKAVKDY